MDLKQAKAFFMAQYPNQKISFTEREYEGIHISYENVLVGKLIQVDFRSNQVTALMQWSEERDHYDYFEVDDEAFLILRTVSQLTNEEKFKISKILHSYGVITPNQTHAKMIQDADWYLGNFTKNYSISAVVVGLINQVLLRIGILLPFTHIDETGKVITLQPEEVISMGWVKTS